MRPAARIAIAAGLALGSALGTPAEAQPLHEERTLALEVRVPGLAFSPDGKTLAGAARDGTLKLWDVRTATLRRTLSAHEGPASAVSYSRDGAMLATCCGKDGSLRLWSTKTDGLLRTVEGVFGGAELAADGKVVAGGVDQRTAGVWDPATGRRLFTLAAAVGEITAATFAPDGATLAVASTDAEVRLWNARTGTLAYTLPELLLASLSLAYSRDGRRMAAGSADGTISIWNAGTWTRERTLGEPGDSSVGCLAFSPDGKWLVACRSDTAQPSNPDQLEVWDLASGEKRQSLTPHQGWINAAVFAPDGRTLATSGSDQAVRFWRVVTP